MIQTPKSVTKNLLQFGTDLTPNTPYRICDIPGKGIGLLAASCLKPGQMIISEPFLVYLLLPGEQINCIHMFFCIFTSKLTLDNIIANL